MKASKRDTSPDLDRIGLFKEMGYLHEYVPVKISFNEASKKGKQLMTNCTKTIAGNQDGFFNKTFNRLFEGEGYMDTIRMNRQYRNERAKKKIDEKVFKYTSPPKKPSGKGSNYGTLAEYVGKIEHFSSSAADKAKAEEPQRNIYVNPPQKGTGYGYPNLTIGKLPPYFLDEEYDELKSEMRETTEKYEFPETLHKPYRAGIFKGGYFDPNPYKVDPKKVPKMRWKPSESKKDKSQLEKKPFLPSGPAKKDGGMKGGCINAFPKHTDEPYLTTEIQQRGVKAYVNAQNEMFRPVPGVRPYPVKSIINKNVQKKINSKNYQTIKGVVYCAESNKPKKQNAA